MAEEQIKEINAALKKVGDDLKGFAETSQKELKNFAAVGEETKASVDKLLVEQGELQARLAQIEQAQAQLDTQGGEAKFNSLGEAFASLDSVKNFKQGTFAINAAAISDAVTRSDGEGNNLIRPAWREDWVESPERTLTIRDLLNFRPTDSNVYQYVREESFTNNATGVDENPKNPKPQSKVELKLHTTNAVTIAHWLPASRQMLRDSGQVANFIDKKLSYGLDLAEEQQLLFGAGGSDVLGIYTQAESYSKPAGAEVEDETAIDRLRLAILQAELEDSLVDGMVLSKTDWANIELLKKSDKGYLFGTAGALLAPTLWGRGVVASNSMTTNKFLIGGFAQGVDAFDLETTNISISTDHDDYFTRNMVAIRAEKDILVAVTRPYAFIKGDLTNATSP